jgi:dolichol-phosphate mannosyltransferase
MQTIIVIPTYNERDNLLNLTKQIFSILPHTDILIVDDNSPDGTGKLAEKLSRKNHQIKVIHRASKLGLGSAYIQGFKYALKNNYDFIFEMDADLSHPPNYLPEFLANTPRYNLILGSRYIREGKVAEWGIWRRFLSYAANLYAQLILGLPYRDLTSGFKCYAKEVLQNLNLDTIISEGYVFQIETTYRAHCKGHTIKEIPIIFKGRKKGKSKISRKICLEAIWKVPLLRFSHI